MRVLHIFNEIKFSGAEIMYANAAPLFQSEGVEMLVLSTGKNVGDFVPQFTNQGIKVIHKPLLNSDSNPVFLYNYFRGILALIKSEGIDVIHIHRSSFYWFFALCGFLKSKRIVRTVHNVFKNRKITWFKAYIERLIARKFFKVKFQTISESVYINELTYYKNPSTCVNNWFDGSRFFPSIIQNEKLQLRKKIGIDNNAFVIISTGGCSIVKNHHDIIKAMAKLPAEISCIYLHLGCGLTEGEEKALAAELNVDNNILFLGNKINVRDFLIASDLFIMPSQYEGLGNAAIEAMACGLPSVLYNVPGLKDLIKDDNNGFLIEPDYNEMAKKIIFFKNNNEIACQKGNNAQKFVSENYSIKKGVQAITNLYH
jgi:glycosyltransferase involved in cell wall biosynthesis